ncbi:MAG: putative transport system permease protein [Pseudomonadota bacterium]|nr:putative transport system permease protein [Pseudomonadota bacterium]
MRAWLNQLAAVTAMNLRNLPARLGTSLVAVVGIGGVVAVLVSLLSMGEGFRAALDLSGRDDVALVLRGGSPDELSSAFGREEVNVIASAPGIARDALGPITSPEFYTIVDLPMRSTGTGANVPFRGVTSRAVGVREGFRIVAGRMFEPGKDEVIVGRGVFAQFGNVDLGREVTWGSHVWRVVGVFEAGGSVSESEVWTDLSVLQGVYRRGNTVQVVRAQLESPAALAELARWLDTDPRVNVSVRSEREFYADQSRILVTLIRYVGTSIAVLMGIGAVFAALNTMYSAVSSRTREIATLRALGFGAAPVLASVLLEAIVLGLLGGIAGGALVYLGLNGYQASTLNWASFSQISFAFTVTPQLLVTGLGYSLILGLVGGLLPGLRAARMPIAAGLREL